MNALTLVFSLLFYIAIDVFLVGMMLKIWKYVSTPAPLKIPQTPAPKTAAGVTFRVFREVAFFRSLFRSNKSLWLGGYLFHLGMLFVFVKHLRFFFPATPAFIDSLVNIDLYTGFIMLAALIFLFILRLAVDRHFYISIVNDYLLLGLLIAIAGTGLLSRFWDSSDTRAMIPHIKEFVGGLFSFSPGPVPTNKLFLIHFVLVMILLIYFPFSKLVHSVGIFFSPTRNQIDNSRIKRWGPWTVKKSRYARSQKPEPVQPAMIVSKESSES